MTQAATGTGLKRFSYERPLIGAESKAFARLAGSTVLDFSAQVVREASETDLRTDAATERLWLVLSGRARFTGGEGRAFGEYGPLEGVHVPRGAPHRFASVGDVDLEILHIAARDLGSDHARQEQSDSITTVRYTSPDLGDNIKVTYILRGEDMLAVSVEKVRSGGGDDGLHTHTGTDSVWFVLSGGRVRFRTPEGMQLVLGPHEGLYVPRGAAYGFMALDEEAAEVLHVKARDLTVANERIDY